MKTRGKIVSKEEFDKKVIPVSKFPRIHNKASSDFKILLSITGKQNVETEEFKTLCRGCLNSLFAIIEVDLWYYNQIDNYTGFKDSHNFYDKFQKTFSQICTTWDYLELKEDYFRINWDELKQLRDIRNALSHPKELADIFEPSIQHFERIQKAFDNYNAFILKIMSDFFIQLTVSI